MKKILLTTAAFAAISTSAFAEMDNQFYLRGDLDGSYFTKFKDSSTSGNSAKIKQKFAVGVDVGAGYYIMDNIRAELIYTQPFSLKMKGTSTKGNTVTVKPKIWAAFARVHGDVVDMGMGKIFLTGGLGWSQVKESVSSTSGASSKARNKNNLAWTVGAGVAFDVAEGVHLDLAYSYRGYGKSKARTTTTGTVGGNTFTSNTGSLGVRFDI